MCLRPLRLSLLAAVAGLALFAEFNPASAGRPGGGGGGTPTPPPVKYNLHYFSSPVGSPINSVQDMNDSGVMVGDAFSGAGGWTGWIYDPQLSSVSALDLNSLVFVPDGWVIAQAAGINNFGAIVAGIERIAQRDPTQPDYERHGVLIDTRQPRVNGRWTAINLPDMADRVSFPRDINNDGVVLGVFNTDGIVYGTVGMFLFDTGLYGGIPELTLVPEEAWSRTQVALSDPASGGPVQVVGQSSTGGVFRYTAGQALADSFAISVNAPLRINGFGEFCGRASVKKSKANQYVSMPFQFDPDSQASPVQLGTEAANSMMIGSDINDAGDVVLDAGWICHSTKGVLNLDQLVQGNSQDVSQWLNSSRNICQVTQRDAATSFPVLGGFGSLSGTKFGVLLLPVAP